MGKRKQHKVPTRSDTTVEAVPSLPIWQRRWIPWVLFAGLSLAYFWGFVTSDRVIFGSDIGYDFHLGAEVSVLEKLGELDKAKWARQMGGYPIYEELRPSFFPTHLIYLFTTYQRQIGWRYLLTVFLAGGGMFLYLREIRVQRWAAIWGGVAFMSAPTFLAFPFAGHYAKMGVIALFPLMCLALERGMRTGRILPFAGLGVFIAFGIFTPHLQMLQYALLAVGLYFIHKLVVGYREGANRRTLAGRSGLFLVAVVLGLGLGAEGLFPAYLHVKSQSKRAAGEVSNRSEEDQLAHARSWSLHPEEVASLLVPEFGGFYDPAASQNRYWGRNPMKANSEYFGILVVLLALLVVPEARRDGRTLFMSLLFLLVLAYTLGGHTPVHWLAYHLVPGAKVLRSPGMAAFLFAFPACVLAAMGLDRVLAAEREAQQALARRSLQVGAALTGIALLVALFPGATLEAWTALLYRDMPDAKRQVMEAGAGWLARGGFLVALVSCAGTAALQVRLRRQAAVGAVVAVLVVLSLLDTWRIDRRFLRYEDPKRFGDFRHENPLTRDFLNGRELHRVFPVPSYSFLEAPGYHLHGTDMVTGFNNYTMRRYDRLLRELGGITAAFEARYLKGVEIPYSDEALLQAAQPLLNLMSARYIVSPRPVQLETPAFPEVYALENVRVYDNPQALPWFYLVPGAIEMADEEAIIAALRQGQVDLRQTAILEQPPPQGLAADPGILEDDRVECLAYDPAGGLVQLRVSCAGPRLLVVSHNYHPNWQASVDGEDVGILRANFVWQAIYLRAGSHDVELRYRSRAVLISRAASILSLLGLLAIGVGVRRRRIESTETSP